MTLCGTIGFWRPSINVEALSRYLDVMRTDAFEHTSWHPVVDSLTSLRWLIKPHFIILFHVTYCYVWVVQLKHHVWPAPQHRTIRWIHFRTVATWNSFIISQSSILLSSHPQLDQQTRHPAGQVDWKHEIHRFRNLCVQCNWNVSVGWALRFTRRRNDGNVAIFPCAPWQAL